MEGFVTDEKGACVKGAIVKLYKKTQDADRQDPADEAKAITYAETDEEGRFLVRGLDPGEKYIIEIHVDISGSESYGGKDVSNSEDRNICPDIDDEIFDKDTDETADDYDEDDRIEEKDIVDSLMENAHIDSTAREKYSINSLYYKTAVDLKGKLYLKKNNLW